MKKIISIISIAAIMIFLTFGPALAKHAFQYDQIVEGTGAPSIDITNVQDAVDQGGKIFLQGTFDFGATTRVLIRNKADGTRNEVEIYGETDRKGNPLTKITGGFWTFYSPLPVIPGSTPPSLPPLLPPGPKITIQGIHFEGALWAPIHIAYSSGATISCNKITGVVPYGPGVFDPTFPAFNYLSAGILFGTYFAQTGISPGRIYREDALIGLLKIRNNYIDLENSYPQNTLGQGIYVNWTTGIMAQISDNIFKNASRNSIELLDNYCDDRTGKIVMDGNEIITPEVGIPYPSASTPNGIVLGWFLDPTGYDEANNCLHIVMHNSIRIRGDTSMGIVVLADDAVVTNNLIVSEGAEARCLVTGGSYGYIAHNNVQGAGKYAIDVVPNTLIPALTANHNFFQGNNYNLFDAALYDLHFAEGANYNVFVGHSGDVLDEGIGNEITNE